MTNIIACIDGSSYSQSVADIGAWTSKKLSAPLTLLHVLDKSSQEADSELSGNIGLGAREQLLAELVELDEQRAKIALKHGKALLSELESHLNDHGHNDIQKRQKHGNLVETLTDMEQDIRVLVMGKSGELHQNDTKTIGSQLESVVRSIKAHILIASGHFSQPDSYILAFDGSTISEKLVEKAINTPLLKGMTCHLVMVEDSDSKCDAFSNASQKLKANGINVVEAQLQGEVHSAILTYQQKQKIGMIVMGAYGHSKLRQFFVGSNTTRIITDTTVPLLLIR
ncbi:nucleotide-binding universal stress UspA family protein [Vibrio diazotrophicus]|uniref:Nucleotide-binding universal stress UspA family protein n=1 Tax=Vibrio diazotrophicus TaxID=685 RepID=A0A329EE80_VIBDI|nr:universal stress protein [Vibrio diazotrophicus]RAS61998.1 nucleotide-binding universal stress UspA family protein [Vibrio diazotrophicus]